MSSAFYLVAVMGDVAVKLAEGFQENQKAMASTNFLRAGAMMSL